MALIDVQQIVSAKPKVATGGILKGSSDSIVPTDATTPLDSTFKPLGYVTDAGVKIKPNVGTTEKKAWGGYVVKVLETDASAELEFSLYQFLSVDALKAAYGDGSVVVTPATAEKGQEIAIRFNGELPEIAPYVVEARDGKKQIRAVVPAFQPNDIPEITFDDNATLDLPFKGKAFPDDDGTLFYVYINDGETTP